MMINVFIYAENIFYSDNDFSEPRNLFLNMYINVVCENMHVFLHRIPSVAHVGRAV